MKQFKFHCPNCGQRFAATYEKAGTASNCTTCKKDMMVPMAPSWLKLGFAKQVIPAILSEQPSLLIRAANSTEGFNALKEAWNEFAQDECDPEEFTPPDDFHIETVANDGAFVVTLTFPKAYRESEAYYGIAILTPPDGSKLTNDTLRFSTKRYFLLSLYGGKTNYEEAIKGKIQSHGTGCSPQDLASFVGWAREKCGLPYSPATDSNKKRENTAINEQALAAAFAEARSTLNAALQLFLNGDYETFSVKFPVIEGDQEEHLWLGDLKYYTDGTFSGIIEDQPKIVSSIVQGQSCEVAYDDVSDWQSFTAGKIHGNYSLRALIPFLSEAEAAKYRAVFADLPNQLETESSSIPSHPSEETPPEAPQNAEPPPVLESTGTSAPPEAASPQEPLVQEPFAEPNWQSAATPAEHVSSPQAAPAPEAPPNLPDLPKRPQLIIPPQQKKG